MLILNFLLIEPLISLSFYPLKNEAKTLAVYIFDGEKFISRTYGEKDKAPVSVLNGLSIELAPVFTS